MLTTKDLENIGEYLKNIFVTKDEFKTEFEALDEKMDRLQTSVDGIAKQFQTNNQETIVQKHKVSRLEAWVIKAAAKIGLDYNP